MYLSRRVERPSALQRAELLVDRCHRALEHLAVMWCCGSFQIGGKTRARELERGAPFGSGLLGWAQLTLSHAIA